MTATLPPVTTMGDFDTMVDGFLESLLWSTIPLDVDGVEPEPFDASFLDLGYTARRLETNTHRALLTYVWAFAEAVESPYLELAAKENRWGYKGVGHDLWLTAVGHGAGFWDGDYSKPVEEALMKACEATCKELEHMGFWINEDDRVEGE